jgi:outer membrane protein assembly factor BamB
MNDVRWSKVSTAVLTGSILVGSSLGADWPNWRGPNYDGHSSEQGFKTAWDGDLKTMWSRDIGAGYSGISLVEGRAYTCGSAGGKQVLLCLDATTGKPIWERPIEQEYQDSMGSGTRGTPTVDDGHVYVMGARGTLTCFDTGEGSQVWSRKYDHVPQWGYSGSVLIQGKLAIVVTGGADGALRALDKRTGKEVWKCGKDGDSGYSTPYPFEFQGGKYVCSFFGNSVVIAELSNGREVLNMPWVTDWKVNAATPIFHDGHLFLSSGYKTGCGLYKILKTGDKLEAREVWRSKVLMNKFQTPVLHEGKLYSFDQTAFKCVDFMTGKEEWKRRGKHGTVLFADGRLIALTAEGRLQIAKASPSGFEPTGEANILDDRCWTVPTLCDGRLYARNLERIVCIDLRG